MKRFEVIISICLIILTLGTFVTFGFGNIGQILCLLVIGLCLYYRKITLDDEAKRYLLVYAVWALAVLFSCLYADVPMQSASKWANRYIWCFMPFVTMLLLVKNSQWGKWCIAVEIFAVTVAGALLTYQGVTTHQRAGSILLETNIMTIGSILACTLPFIFVCVMDERVFGKYRWYVLPAFLICNFGLLYNQTRGAWISCGVMYLLTFGLYFMRNKKVTVAILIVFFAVGTYMFMNPYVTRRWTLDPAHSSNSVRIRIWQAAYNMWKDNPVLGVGYMGFENRYQNKYMVTSAAPREKRFTHAHNNCMMILSEQGIIGLGSFLFCYLFFVYEGWKNYRKYNDPYSLMTVVTTLGGLMYGLIECNLHMPFYLRIYWLVQGIILAMHMQWRREHDCEINCAAL